MEQIFTPKIARPVDTLAGFFLRLNQFLILALLAIVPFIFIPGMIGPFKTFFAIFVVLVCVVVSSFGILRQGVTLQSFPVILLAWFGVVMAMFVSAVLSNDVIYSLRGDMIEPQTVAFLVLLGVIMLLVYSFGRDKKVALWMIVIPIVTTTILAIHQLTRFFLTDTFFDFGVLSSSSDTLIGNFNDLGIFLTAGILIMLIAVVQLKLRRVMMGGLLALLVLNLLVLMVVNISYLWIVLGFTSLLLLMFLLTRDRFMGQSPRLNTPPFIPSVIMTFVFVISVVFFVGGSNLGTVVSSWVGVSYIEVRPSITATLDVTRQILSDNAFTGIGPNRFADAWQLYKDQSINQTIFWNTGFFSGASYILTWFATTGIIGIIAWLVFFLVFLYRGVKTLFIVESRDPFWFFVGTVSFVLALYLWGTMWLYSSGSVILIFTAMMTGLYLMAERALYFTNEIIIPKPFTSTRMGFALIAVVMLMVITTVATGYTVAQQFTSLTTYLHATDGVEGVDATSQISTNLLRAHSFYPSDVFLRDIIAYQFRGLNSLLSASELDASQKQQLNNIIDTMVKVSNDLVQFRPYRARNWATVGDVYALLAQIDNGGTAFARANEAYQKAIILDPLNPYYPLQIGLLEIRSGDRALGRVKLAKALELKKNYVEALGVLSQLDIEEGNIVEAIRTTEALVMFEPDNYSRFYQLGILYGAAENRELALGAFSRAIEINPQFANARYMYALHLYSEGKLEEAIKELESVLVLDTDNTLVSTVIETMQDGTFKPDFKLTTSSVNEPATVTVQDDVVTTNEVPDSNFISSVNNASFRSGETETVVPSGETEGMMEEVAPTSIE